MLVNPSLKKRLVRDVDAAIHNRRLQYSINIFPFVRNVLFEKSTGLRGALFVLTLRQVVAMFPPPYFHNLSLMDGDLDFLGDSIRSMGPRERRILGYDLIERAHELEEQGEDALPALSLAIEVFPIFAKDLEETEPTPHLYAALLFLLDAMGEERAEERGRCWVTCKGLSIVSAHMRALEGIPV